jgi:hypothetical protein
MSTGDHTKSSTLPLRAVDGFKERTLKRKRHQTGQLLKLKHGWAVRYYESGDSQRRRVQLYLGDFTELPTPRSAKNAMQAEMVRIKHVHAASAELD